VEGEPAAVPGGPTGPGWVVQITGHHFHNEERGNEGEQFVRSTLVRGLLGEGDGITVAAGSRAGEQVSVADLGIGFPVLVTSSPILPFEMVEGGSTPAFGGRPGMEGGSPTAAPVVKLKRYAFVLQFAWQPATPGSKLPKPVAAPAATP
jgi:type IV pilus assembly protein PilM